MVHQDGVNAHLERVVWTDNQYEQMRFFILEDVLEGCPGPPLHLLAVFLLELLVERVLVLEDKMKLGIASTLVRPKHNRVGGLVCDLSKI